MPGRGPAAAYGLRVRGVPQRRGVLEPADGDVHDSGKLLHPAVRILRGAEGCAAAGGLGRTGAGRRGVRGDGAEVRGDHEREPGRSEGRGGRTVRLDDQGDPGADSGLRGRGAGAGLSGIAGGDGDGDGGGAGRVEPQHRDGAAAVPAGAAWGAVRAVAGVLACAKECGRKYRPSRG